MKDLAGFARRYWKTGFTSYRYAIPAFAGDYGRAIYNEFDQVYLADSLAPFDQPMGDTGVLSIDDLETSVMLLDAARMLPGSRFLQRRTQARMIRLCSIFMPKYMWMVMQVLEFSSQKCSLALNYLSGRLKYR